MAMVVYEGKSLLTGAPIVVLATFQSGNSKTGAMTQTHIVTGDVSPRDALNTGADVATCGDCVHRSVESGGNGSCYVHPIIRRGRGTSVAWQQWSDGLAVPFNITAFSGRPLRLGTYGDPAAVPFEIWQQLMDAVGSAGHTGYTHAWRYCDQRLAKWLMASCDSPEDTTEANSMGWDTFTVHPVGTERPSGLKPCPASKEMGYKLQCAQCLRCGGTSTGRRANNVAIMAHGGGAKRFVGKSLPLAVVK